MPADIQVNTAQSGVWKYCFRRETCRDSWQLSLPLRQIPAQMISRWQIKKTFCVSTGKWAFTGLRNKCSRDKKIVGKNVSGICRAAKAEGEFRLPPFWKRASSHTPTASFWSSFRLCMSTFLVLMQQVWTFVLLMFMLVFMLMSQCKPGFRLNKEILQLVSLH